MQHLICCVRFLCHFMFLCATNFGVRSANSTVNTSVMAYTLYPNKPPYIKLKTLYLTL